MASAVKYYCFVENLAEKVHNLGADTLKIMLSNTAPNQSTHTIRSDSTELGGGSGYTSGGTAVTVTGSSQTTGTYTLTQSADVIFTASGSVGPFRYAILYNDTSASPLDPLIVSWDYASSITLASGETFTVDLAATILSIV